MKIHTFDHIATRLQEIQNVLEAEYDGDEGNVLMDRLTKISTYMAESGKLKADAEYHYNSKLSSEIMRAFKDLIPEYTSATVQNAWVKSLAKDELQLLTLAERVNRSATHQIDCMRTQLSYIKGLINS
ncbi:MAG TPA: hypothetical protein PK210_05200 [Bacteroidia bacterium]|nr:hypothetical protein [Bacteroidia bacterium]